MGRPSGLKIPAAHTSPRYTQMQGDQQTRSNRSSEIVIRAGLDGLHSAEIIASESWSQNQLSQLWDTLRPILESALAITAQTGAKGS